MKKKTNTFNKLSDSSDNVYVEGWANKAIADRVGDIIPSDAWDLENYKKVPILLYNHERDKPIGRASVIEARDGGLWIKAKLSNSADPDISKVRSLVKEGILNAFSVGIEEVDSYRENEFNIFKRCELLEVSIVTVPMNQDSTFSYSNKHAKMNVKKGLKTMIDTEKYSVLAYQVLADSESLAMERVAALELDLASTSLEMIEEGVYVAILDNSMDRLSAEQIELEPGVIAYVMPLDLEEKAALDGDTSMVDDNPHLEAARQTNILLAMLIEEMKQIKMMIAEKPEARGSDEPVSELEEIRLAMGKLAATLSKLGGV